MNRYSMLKNILSIFFLLQASATYAAVTPTDFFDVGHWITYYYQNPTPERAYDAIRHIHIEDLFVQQQHHYRIIMVFSEIFRDNPNIVADFIEKSPFLTQDEIRILAQALWYANTDASLERLAGIIENDTYLAAAFEEAPDQPPEILESEFTRVHSIDACAALFSITGDTRYIKKILEQFKHHADNPESASYQLYAWAVHTLSYQCIQHELVRQHCRSVLDSLPNEEQKVLQHILDVSTEYIPVRHADDEFRGFIMRIPATEKMHNIALTNLGCTIELPDRPIENFGLQVRETNDGASIGLYPVQMGAFGIDPAVQLSIVRYAPIELQEYVERQQENITRYYSASEKEKMLWEIVDEHPEISTYQTVSWRVHYRKDVVCPNQDILRITGRIMKYFDHASRQDLFPEMDDAMRRLINSITPTQ